MGRPDSLTSGRGSQLTLRPAAIADSERLFQWRNDPQTVRFSGTGRAVTDDEHRSWLGARLATAAPRLWIAEEDGAAVGQARLDVDGSTAIVSIGISPEHRGGGRGLLLLRELIQSVGADAGITALVGHVHRDNTASLRTFERAGFRHAGQRPDGFVVMEWP